MTALRSIWARRSGVIVDDTGTDPPADVMAPPPPPDVRDRPPLPEPLPMIFSSSNCTIFRNP